MFDFAFLKVTDSGKSEGENGGAILTQAPSRHHLDWCAILAQSAGRAPASMRAALFGANRASTFLMGVQHSRAASSRVRAGLGMSCRHISADADGLRVRYGAKVESGELIDDRYAAERSPEDGGLTLLLNHA